MNVVILFAVCTAVNVILSTIKSIATVNGGKWMAALMNAITYGFYTVVIILTNAEMPLWEKMTITAGCNFFGVFIVKLIEEKARKDRLWKIEFTIKGADNAIKVDNLLTEKDVPHNYVPVGKHTVFNCYCATKADTDKVSAIIKIYNGKYFASEGKVVL